MPQQIRSFELKGYEIADPARAYLGEGTYGTVLLGKESSTGRAVAIKKHHHIVVASLHREALDDGALGVRKRHFVERLAGDVPIKTPPKLAVCREVGATDATSSVATRGWRDRLLDIVHDQSSKETEHPTSYMIFERLDCDLHAYASNHRPLQNEEIQRIMYHILLGLHHCHAIGLMHRDLKPHNILLDTTDPVHPTAKLADFGFGRTFSSLPIRPMTDEIITLWYRPPEVLLGFLKGHSPAADIWSTACIFAELYEHATPFSGQTQLDQITLIFRVLGTPTTKEWRGLRTCAAWHEFPDFKPQNFRDVFTGTAPGAIELLERMLVHDPALRLTAEECLRHAYFAPLFREEDLEMPPLWRSDILPDMPQPPSAPQTDPVLLPSHTPNIFTGEFGKQQQQSGST